MRCPENRGRTTLCTVWLEADVVSYVKATHKNSPPKWAILYLLKASTSQRGMFSWGSPPLRQQQAGWRSYRVGPSPEQGEGNSFSTWVISTSGGSTKFISNMDVFMCSPSNNQQHSEYTNMTRRCLLAYPLPPPPFPPVEAVQSSYQIWMFSCVLLAISINSHSAMHYLLIREP
jgi:hypothetical protein